MKIPFRPARFLLAVLLAVLVGASVRADMQTLTDKQGRSIKADVISVSGDKVKIRRDDGLTFELDLSNLADADQNRLKEWAAKEAEKIPEGALRLELSRGVFSSSKKEDEAVITTEEKWGYSITVSNTTSRAFGDLRFKYVLFVKPDLDPGKDTQESKLKRVDGTSKINSLEGHGRTVFRTSTIDIYKQKLKPGWIWGKTGQSEMIRDKLYGIWIKTYIGDQLVSEICNPESLAKTEKGP
jgi:hypothetical protein